MPQPSSRVLEATLAPCFRGEARAQSDRAALLGRPVPVFTAIGNEFLNLAENWRPWRAYAAIYLWASDAGGLRPDSRSD
jgi:3-methyladenine DNA glycosylase/8-oxoguanine DNA glycosylase